MKFAVQVVLGLSLVAGNAAFAAPAAAPSQAAATNPAHVKSVQDLLAAMQVEKVLRGVAGRSRYPSEAQRKEVFAKLDRTPPAEVHRRLAAPLASVISADTAAEMTRFYNTPYGKKVIHDKYNSGPQIMFPGSKPVVPPEEKKERKRAAYVKASKELADAQPAIESEAFKLLQALNKEKR
ncbi:hypothetical protein LK542_22165 [Massilia sp. IC2-477]|uniref:hypothetical protein n=1 Tax=unclassified Massilia TaxID=2609279 RepID=UPI001D1202FF|nr:MULTISPECIES: hypothetical protein [unclassified Massilia]MCC2958324.1 hypothetical protein [Massilia sp. IC2-477]MCC2974241.1 hypothetical protein [Massilia sp. IC2-476]